MHELNLKRRLQLLGLGRIDRCGSCPRFLQLQADPAASTEQELPKAPGSCKHRACKPLVQRYRTALSITAPNMPQSYAS